VQATKVEVPYEKKSISLHLFQPKRRSTHGAMFLIPGVHFQGGEHSAIVRIASIMAHAGFFVGVPSLPDFISLRITPAVLKQAETAFASFLRQEDHPHTSTCITSISFGSLPAFALASMPHLQDAIGGVVTFGGYLEWIPVMRFCLDDSPGIPCDARNFPIVFTLLSDYWAKSHDTSTVLQAWDHYIHQTWVLESKPNKQQRREIAQPIAQQLSPENRKIFLQGCGLTEDWKKAADNAMKNMSQLDWLNNHTRISQMTCPLVAIHAMTDEIVPPEQAQKLYSHQQHHPFSQCYCTAIYGHSGQDTSSYISALTLYKEMRILLSILRKISYLSSIDISKRK